jgi:hypothetical protein
MASGEADPPAYGDTGTDKGVQTDKITPAHLGTRYVVMWHVWLLGTLLVMWHVWLLGMIDCCLIEEECTLRLYWPSSVIGRVDGLRQYYQFQSYLGPLNTPNSTIWP